MEPSTVSSPAQPALFGYCSPKKMVTIMRSHKSNSGTKEKDNFDYTQYRNRVLVLVVPEVPEGPLTHPLFGEACRVGGGE